MLKLERLLAPVVGNLYVCLQENLFSEEHFHILTRLHAYLLDGAGALADDNTLLGVPLHVDHGADPDDVLFLLKGVDGYLGTVGDLLLIVYEDLLPDDLRREKPLCPVCILILGKLGRMFGHKAQQFRQQLVHMLAGFRGDGQNFFDIGQVLCPVCHFVFDLRTFYEVGFVDDQEDGCLYSLEAFKQFRFELIFEGDDQ